MAKSDTPEVKAFFSKLNFFRKPLRYWSHGTWKEDELYAGGAMVQKVLDGKSELSLRLNRKTSFFCLDLDRKTPMSEPTLLPMEGLFTTTFDLGQAISVVASVFRRPPSLIVASPHGGAHLFYCLTPLVPWTQEIEDKLTRHRDRTKKILGTGQWDVELLPTPCSPLRLPHRDRILDPVTFTPLPTGTVTAEIWDDLVAYPLEELLDPSLGKDSGAAGTEEVSIAPARSHGSPRTRAQAERSHMPFRNGETNQQLPQFVNAACHEGLSLDDTLEWIKDCIARSRKSGYTGDLGTNSRQLETRVKFYFEGFRSVSAISTKFWLALWNSEKPKSPPEFRWAEEALTRLKTTCKVSSRSEAALRRFFASVHTWKAILERSRGQLDKLTLEALSRGALPLPTALLEVWYSGYKAYWASIQASGLLVADPDASYIPIKGRVQYYRVVEIE